ncbi:MAG TPA: hypothetical protein VK079_00805 [Bacillota bacterium]|nr:hypothetical protein [Bacillota bacterium]
MLKRLQISILIFLILLIGCSQIATYDDHEVVAIVKDEKITVDDMRFLYPDDTAFDYLNWMIKVELIKQEVEAMGIDLSEQINDEVSNDWFAELPPKHTKDEGGKQIRQFAESQAKKLNMNPEQYQREYAKKIIEQNVYVVTYLEEMLGEAAFDDKEDMELFNEKGHNLLEQLVEEHAAEIERLIE